MLRSLQTGDGRHGSEPRVGLDGNYVANLGFGTPPGAGQIVRITLPAR